ncbi:MAG: hypothetical protein Q8P67_02180 [archaeon]|nr:hypothetical protein [archaeon]
MASHIQWRRHIGPGRQQPVFHRQVSSHQVQADLRLNNLEHRFPRFIFFDHRSGY